MEDTTNQHDLVLDYSITKYSVNKVVKASVRDFSLRWTFRNQYKAAQMLI